MPRFFIHVRDDGALIEDAEGSELPNLEAARAEALTVARELIAEGLAAQKVEICDEAGQILASVTVRYALH